MNASTEQRNAKSAVLKLRKQLAEQTPSSAGQLATEASLQDAIARLEVANASYMELRQQVNVQMVDSLEFHKKVWGSSRQQVKDAQEKKVSKEELETLLTEEARAKAVYDQASLEHTLEVDALTLHSESRNGSTTQLLTARLLRDTKLLGKNTNEDTRRRS